MLQNFRSKANEALEDPDEEIEIAADEKDATPLTALWYEHCRHSFP